MIVKMNKRQKTNRVHAVDKLYTMVNQVDRRMSSADAKHGDAPSMDMVGLISGGKDSMYNMMKAVEKGWKIVALANLYPSTGEETDSYMYQTVGSEGIQMIAEAMSVPLYRREIAGKPLLKSFEYDVTDGDEVEDLTILLEEVKGNHPDVRGVSAGAIFSSYQKLRVESVCERLHLKPVCLLWERDQKELLHEMIANGVEAIIIKVAAAGLFAEHLGKTLSEMEPILLKLAEKYDVHPCGEGGEFESFVLNSPLFHKKILLEESEVVMHQEDEIAPVAYLKLKKLKFEEKMQR